VARRICLHRTFVWLFAGVWFVVLALVSPLRGSAPAPEPAGRTPSALVAPARDPGKVVLRHAPAITIAAPASEPLPALPLAHQAPRIARAEHAALAFAHFDATDPAVLVVRWQRHIPRMDSGEPPRSDAFAS
jgi:hypothetical protein